MNDSAETMVAPDRVRTRSGARIFPAVVPAIFLALLLWAGSAVGPSAALAEGWAYDLAGELMSPFCPGRTLSSCPSPQAAELVQWISVQEAAGVSQDEVVEILVAKWGEEILGAPPAEGITLWAYVFPVLGFVVLGGIALFAIRQMAAGSKAVPVYPAAGANPAAGASPATGASAEAIPERPAVPAGPLGEAEKEELARIVQAELASRA